jgi:hypothetical protein
MVDPVPPAVTRTTVHDRPDDAPPDAPPRGLGAGIAITLLAIAIAVAFGAARDDPTDTAHHVVTAQARSAETGAPSTTGTGAPTGRAFGVPFPDLVPRLGWRPVARRDDVVDDRAVTTVQYARGGRRLAWSVVDGPPVPPPPGAVRVSGRGPGAWQFESGGRLAVITTRGGRSVVVSAAAVPRTAIVRAARAG